MSEPRKRYLQCPCGQFLEANDEDGIVEVAEAHLAAQHPGRVYTREQILLMAS